MVIVGFAAVVVVIGGGDKVGAARFPTLLSGRLLVLGGYC